MMILQSIFLRSPLILLVSAMVLSMSVATDLHAGSFREIDNSPVMPDLDLVDHEGASFGNAQLEGHWTLVLIGFTSCPDVCPYTLGNLEHVLAETSSRVRPDNLPQVVFLAVDPVRDIPNLANYVEHFHPDYIGVSGNIEAIDEFVAGLDGFYAYDEADASGFYNVRHSAEVRVLNPEGRLVASLQPPMNASTTADFLLKLQIDRRRQLQ
ncbi:MAG: SCO family protein [Granulosicoccus sp.]|nr:SCO family protein [Granulosicoccus sp.]